MKTANKTQIAKWGNSLAVRLPRQIIETARLREGDQLNLSVAKNGAVIIRPARQKYRLEDLVAGITASNLHDETDWGGPVGEEIW